MPNITWKLPDGSTVTAAVAAGVNLMAAAVDNNIHGVVGECGGCLSCATCHVYVDDAWLATVGAAEGNEDATLEITEAPKLASSRLSCQIIAAPALDGLVLHVPA